MSLRIAQLANFVGPTSGGMKVAIEALGAGYVAAGHERILVIPGARDSTTETENGIVVEVASPKIAPMYRMIAKPWRALAALEKFKPTSVEVSDKWTLSPAAGWARRRGIGSVLFSHERLDDMLANWVRRQFGVEAVVGALNRKLASNYDVVVVTSRYAAGEFEQTSANLRLVPLGVDLETFHPDRGQPPADGPTRICYVGRMSHEKHPQLGVAAVVELHRRGVPVVLDMYGTGADVEEMRAIAGDAPVVFHGFVAGRDEVAKRFATHDISYSVSPTETFGLAVLEALACGTPVVSADRGGASEIVTPACGEQGAPDAVGIADATERLIARLGEGVRIAARQRAEQYRWQTSVDAMVTIHQDLADDPPLATRRKWRDKETP